MSRVTHLLIHRVTLTRNAPVDMGAGRFKDNFVVIGEDVPFRLSQLAGAERVVAQQRLTYQNYNGYGEPTLDIVRGDVVIDVAGAIGPAGTEYRVMDVTRPSIAHHTKTTLERIEKSANAT